MLVKIRSTQNKHKSLKGTRERGQVTYEEKNMQPLGQFISSGMCNKRMGSLFQMLREQNRQSRDQYQSIYN